MSNGNYLSNSLTYVHQSEIGERVNCTSNTGTVLISAANSNTDGTGTTYTVLTAENTILKTVTIKAIGNTTRGMVRLFVKKGSNNYLLMEIPIPAVVISSVDAAFEVTLNVNYALEDNLVASTENAESFVVTATSVDIAYP